MKILIIIFVVVLFCIEPGCKEKAEENKVDFNQINVDNSNDYRYIFRDRIKEEKIQNEKNRQRAFSD